MTNDVYKLWIADAMLWLSPVGAVLYRNEWNSTVLKFNRTELHVFKMFCSSSSSRDSNNRTIYIYTLRFFLYLCFVLCFANIEYKMMHLCP